MAQTQVSEAIAALKAGEKERARTLLMAVLDDDPQNEDAWLVLSAAIDDVERKRQCLETVLEINPDNQVARRGLERLQPEGERPGAGEIEEAAATPPAPPDATVAAATDPQPAEPAPSPAGSGEAPPLPSFEEQAAERGEAREAESPMEAAAEPSAPPDAIVAAETPPVDDEAPAEGVAQRRQQRWVAIIGIVVGLLLLFMIGVWVVIYFFFL